MHRHFERELKRLLDLFANLCNLVEKNFSDLLGAMEKMDGQTLEFIKKNDKIIDENEILIEEECLKILALYQPVAGDLRQIVAILKINNDMERIGDLTANIASRSLSLQKSNLPILKYLIPEMAFNVKKMLKDAVDSVLQKKLDLAVQVCSLDDEIDKMHAKMYQVLQGEFEKNPALFTAYMNYISISRFLERIADHTTNIAEDLLYMLEGEIFRHRERIELGSGNA